jgi:hypothetical protein
LTLPSSSSSFASAFAFASFSTEIKLRLHNSSAQTCQPQWNDRGLYEYTNFHATQQEMFTFKMLTVHAKPARGKYFVLLNLNLFTFHKF